MGRKSVRLFGSLATLVAVVAIAPTAVNGNADVHFFKIRIVSSGSVAIDYGDDRHEPGLTTSAGVDGQDSLSWSWEIRAVGKSVAAGSLASTAAVVRAREDHSSNLVDYDILMGKVLETPLCPAVSNVTLATDDNRGAEATRRPDWIRQTDPVKVGGGALRGGPSVIHFAACIHGFEEHGLAFLSGAYGDDARVPRGAFNPRFDRSFKDSFPLNVNEGRDHDLADLNQLHTFIGKSKLKVQIKAIGADAYRKQGREYHNTARGRSADFGF